MEDLLNMSKKGIDIVSFIIKVVGGVVGLLIAKAVIDEVNRKTYCSVKGYNKLEEDEDDDFDIDFDDEDFDDYDFDEDPDNLFDENTDNVKISDDFFEEEI